MIDLVIVAYFLTCVRIGWLNGAEGGLYSVVCVLSLVLKHFGKRGNWICSLNFCFSFATVFVRSNCNFTHSLGDRTRWLVTKFWGRVQKAGCWPQKLWSFTLFYAELSWKLAGDSSWSLIEISRKKSLTKGLVASMPHLCTCIRNNTLIDRK